MSKVNPFLFYTKMKRKKLFGYIVNDSSFVYYQHLLRKMVDEGELDEDFMNEIVNRYSNKLIGAHQFEFKNSTKMRMNSITLPTVSSDCIRNCKNKIINFPKKLA